MFKKDFYLEERGKFEKVGVWVWGKDLYVWRKVV